MPMTAPRAAAPSEDAPPRRRLLPWLHVSRELPPVRRPADDALLSDLRLLRAEIQDLRAVLAQVHRGEAPLRHFVEYIAITREQVRDIIGRVRTDDDCVRRILNAWEQLESCSLIRRPDEELSPQLQVQCLNLLEGQCRQIAYWCCHRTIPERVIEWLRDTQPGYAIPFHMVFEDELPDHEDRQKILNHLALAPNVLKPYGGLADPENGVVYSYEPELSKRIGSLVRVALALLLATALVLAAGTMVPVEGVGASRQVLLIGWIAVLLGSLVHVGVATAKRASTLGGSPVVLPVRRFLLVVNAREGLILLRTFMAGLGYLGYVFGVGSAGETKLQAFMFSAFLVGYSLDSVVDLLGSSFDQRAVVQSAVLRKQFGAG